LLLQVGWLFTDDDELMVRMVSEIAPLVAAYQVHLAVTMVLATL
jgi:hypothetical protein